MTPICIKNSHITHVHKRAHISHVWTIGEKKSILYCAILW